MPIWMLENFLEAMAEIQAAETLQQATAVSLGEATKKNRAAQSLWKRLERRANASARKVKPATKSPGDFKARAAMMGISVIEETDDD